MSGQLRVIFFGLVFIVLSLLNSGCRQQPSGRLPGRLTVTGSDTIVNLSQAWAERFLARHPGTDISVTGGGSGVGIASLINRSADVANSSRAMEPAEIDAAKSAGISPVQKVVALDGLAVVVHRANPVNALSIPQLSAIFSGRITNWRRVGGRDRPIILLSREVNSGTHVYFKEHVVRRDNKKSRLEFSPKALLMPSSEAIALWAAKSPDAIGYVGAGYVSGGLKALRVSRAAGGPAIMPTAAAIRSGEYPISRPLFMITGRRPSRLARDFISFAVSRTGQEIVTRQGFVPTAK